MKTALSASGSKNGKVSVTESGGEIDIFCRRKQGNQSRLAVIEVKDSIAGDEGFEDAIYQAISCRIPRAVTHKLRWGLAKNLGYGEL
jgi:hypothetical protein